MASLHIDTIATNNMVARQSQSRQVSQILMRWERITLPPHTKKPRFLTCDPDRGTVTTQLHFQDVELQKVGGDSCFHCEIFESFACQVQTVGEELNYTTPPEGTVNALYDLFYANMVFITLASSAARRTLKSIACLRKDSSTSAHVFYTHPLPNEQCGWY